MYKCLRVKYPLFLSDSNETWIFSAHFLKEPECQISSKSAQWEPSCSVRTDGRTDRVAFRNFANSPMIRILIICDDNCLTILSQLNPLHIFKTYWFKILINIEVSFHIRLGFLVPHSSHCPFILTMLLRRTSVYSEAESLQNFREIWSFLTLLKIACYRSLSWTKEVQFTHHFFMLQTDFCVSSLFNQRMH